MATSDESDARPIDLTRAVGANSQEVLGTPDVPDTGGVHDDDTADDAAEGGHLGETAIALSGD